MKKIIILLLVFCLGIGIVAGIAKTSDSLVSKIPSSDTDTSDKNDTNTDVGGDNTGDNTNTPSDDTTGGNTGDDTTGGNTGDDTTGDDTTTGGETTITKVSSIGELDGANHFFSLDMSDASAVADNVVMYAASGYSDVFNIVNDDSAEECYLEYIGVEEQYIEKGSRFDFNISDEKFYIQNYDVVVVEFDISSYGFYPSAIVFYPYFRYSSDDTLYAFESKKVVIRDDGNSSNSLTVTNTSGSAEYLTLSSDRTLIHHVTMIMSEDFYVCFIDGRYALKIDLGEHLSNDIYLDLVRVSTHYATFTTGDNFYVKNYSITTFGDGNGVYTSVLNDVLEDPINNPISNYVE